MKSIKFKSALLLAILFAAVISEPVWADRGRHASARGRAHFGVFIGAPLVWSYPPAPYYYPGPYYYPSIIAVPSSPPVYIEQDPLPVQQYWYFCGNPQGYYPYVKQCPAGWQQVMPQPPGN